MPLRLSLLLIGMLFISALGAQEPAGDGPADVSVFVFASLVPQADVPVSVDGDLVGSTNRNGALFAELTPDEHELVISPSGFDPVTLPLALVPGENVQVLVRLTARLAPSVSVESSNEASEASGLLASASQEIEGDPGTLSGYVYSADGGAAVANARVFVSGTAVDIRTDEGGRFSVELPPGDYSLSVMHPDHATLTRSGLAVASDEERALELELVPAGLELPEFVVVEPYVEGTLGSVVALRREATVVTDVLSAEQIARAGDSDAGSALQRVTGLTLVEGSFIFVRGLGERYSNVLLNGANLPSPDPTRRVLPLDLFPTDIISQIVVQKTSDASMPGEFGGGSVQLKTVEYPAEFLFRISASSGFNSESAGENGQTSPGGDDDWLGLDDGTRAVPPLLAERIEGGEFLRPASIFNPEGATPEELEAIGEEIGATSFYGTLDKKLPADRSMAVSLGNSFELAKDVQVGFLGAVQYSDQWRLREEQRDTFRSSASGLQPNDSLAVERTVRNIDVGTFLNAGISFSDWTRLGVNLMLLRQSESETRIDDGQQDTQRLKRFLLEWNENELTSTQLFGEHRVPWLGTDVTWQYTTATATRADPNVRSWRRDDDNEDGVFLYSRRADSNSQFWGDLNDDLTNGSIDFRQPLPELGPLAFTLRAGWNGTERERESSIRTFSFIGGVPLEAAALDQEDILTPEFISPSGLRLREGTTPSDNYSAEQDLTAYYGSVEFTAFDDVTFVAGVRREDNFQEVLSNDLTNPEAPPTVGLIEATDSLWSGSLTYRMTERAQLRFGYSETLSRPDFREISPSPFIDPTIDLRTVGNPDLEVTSITNWDGRVEYYFDEVDSVSLALFYKELVNPIERVTSSGGSGTIITLQNALGAEIEGWEFDLYRGLGFVNDQAWLDGVRLGWLRRIGLENFFVAANYADITTLVSIDPTASNATNADRFLQGASPWVVNLQMGYNSPDDSLELTVLYNSFGERISRAGTLGQPDIFEQPFEQVDVVARYRFDRFTLKFSVENLLDSTVEFTQGEETTRIFKPGRKVGMGLSFKF